LRALGAFVVEGEILLTCVGENGDISLDNFLKKLFYCVISLLLASATAWAEDPFGGFQQYADRPSLKPFARDLGAVLGAATFHNGASLGFSGFDVGIRGGFRFNSEAGNRPLRDKGTKGFGLPWVQAEIGLPFGLDGYIRGVSFQGTTIAGGGMRYGINKKTESPWLPQVLVAWSAHSVAHQQFSASQTGLNLVASLNFKKFSPYLGAGADRTRLVVRSSPVRDPALLGEAVSVVVPRATVGLSLRPKAYVYLHFAATYTNRVGVDSGIGIRF